MRAAQIGDGQFEPIEVDYGHNGLGDIGRQLELVAYSLRERDAEIAGQEVQIEEMLRSILPARLMARVRRGEYAIAEALETAAVLSLRLDWLPSPTTADQADVVELTSAVMKSLDDVRKRYDVERSRMSSDRQLFCTGHGEPGAGDIAAAIIGHGDLAFTIFGDPVAGAMTLEALAKPGEILRSRCRGRMFSRSDRHSSARAPRPNGRACRGFLPSGRTHSGVHLIGIVVRNQMCGST